MHHYRKTRQTYSTHNKADKRVGGCSFPYCNKTNTQEILLENKTMFVIANRVSYDMFEGRRVLDHLMVIPKRHVEKIADFTDQEKLDLLEIAGKYDAKGYNTYARGIGSVSRSVKHQHTHLIRLADTKPRAVIFSQKPYFLIDF